MATAAELALLLKARDQASRVLQRFQKNLQGVEKASGRMARSFKFAAPVVGGGVAGLAGAAISTGFAFNILRENAQLAFTTMLGSGDKATAMLDSIEKTAKKTPFGFEDLTRGAQRMLAFGFAAEDVIPTLTAVGDAVSAMGGTGDVINRVIIALGQMQAKGKVQAQEMMQLTEAGIPAWQILAEQIDEVFGPERAARIRKGQEAMLERLQAMGKTPIEAQKIVDQKTTQQLMKLAETGKLPADKVIAALRRGMQQRFGGLGEKQSKTVAGAASTFKDTLQQLLGDLTEGPFKSVAENLLKIASAMDSIREHFKGLPEPIKSAISWLTTFGMLIGIGGGVALGITGLVGGLGGLVGRVKGLSGALRGLAGFVGATGPLALLIGGALALKEAWERDFAGIKSHVEKLLEPLGSAKKIITDIIGMDARTILMTFGFVLGQRLGGRIGEWLDGTVKDLAAQIGVSLAWAGTLADKIGHWIANRTTIAAGWVNTWLRWAGDLAGKVGGWLADGRTIVAGWVDTWLRWAGDLGAKVGGWIADGQTIAAGWVDTWLRWAGTLAVQVGSWLAEGSSIAAGWVETYLRWAGDLAGKVGAWLTGADLSMTGWVQAWLRWGGDLAAKVGAWLEGADLAGTGWVQAWLQWAGSLAGKIGPWLEGTTLSAAGWVQTWLQWAGDLAGKVGAWLADGASLLRTIDINFGFLDDAAQKFFDWIVGGSTGGRVVEIVGNGGGGGTRMMATGGLVMSPTLAMIGERGPEVVIPLDRLSEFGGGRGQTVHNHYHLHAQIVTTQDAQSWWRRMQDENRVRGGTG